MQITIDYADQFRPLGDRRALAPWTFEGAPSTNGYGEERQRGRPPVWTPPTHPRQ